jgi:dihydrofolate reductase
MATVTISTAITVDGVMSVEDWYVPGGGHHRAGLELFDRAAAMLLGRKNYEGLAGYWAPETGPWAERINPLPKYVASRTLREPLTWNASLLEGDLGEAVSRLKGEFDGELLSVGCGELARSLLAYGVVDELRFWIHPAVWGGGERPFFSQARLRLRAARGGDVRLGRDARPVRAGARRSGVARTVYGCDPQSGAKSNAAGVRVSRCLLVPSAFITQMSG